MSKKGNHTNLVVLSISFIIISLNFFIIAGYSWEIDSTGTVYNIVDGDTIDVTSVGRIRLADIDCPESGESGGVEATQYISSLIYQKEVYVDVDDVSGTDPYGRVVAVIYVYYDDTRLKNVNKAMVAAGHADIWDFDNNEFNPYSWTLYVNYQSNPPPDPSPPDDPLPPDPVLPDDSSPQLSPKGVDYVWLGVGGTIITIGAITGTYALKSKKKLKPKLRNVKNVLFKKPRSNPKPQYTKTVSNTKGISLKDSKTLIKDITPSLSNLYISGKVEKINDVRDFVRKDGSHGRVGSFSISDETGTIKIVLWDNNCSLLSQNNIAVGKQVKIVNVYSKINSIYGKNDLEIHFGKFSKLEI
ncbi:hypothetical protein LCGC14_0705950 [marine sediment metagenome]|uniref:TNase-like domain-containing protein n=1 Tax=marine sediment metagenome TaxID=412755 RepID=A0A0F9QL03_9ZZZZ|nr:hypothetical protein [bacterium]